MSKRLPRCPDCGSPIVIDEHASTLQAFAVRPLRDEPVENHLEYRPRRCVVAFCSGCEWAVELPVLR